MRSEEFLSPPPIEFEEGCDPLMETVAEFEAAARYLDLESWIVHRLRHAEREITVNLSLVRDNGDVTGIIGYRVQHHCGRGPTLGGIRLSPEATLAHTRAAALAMSLQLALLDLPMGGAAGAVICNPAELSESEIQSIVRDYVRALRGVTGSQSDVLAPDEGCNEQAMSWMLDNQRTTTATGLDLGAVTGKPRVLWGLPGFAEALAMGVVLLGERALGASPGDRRVGVQGFGVVGKSIAQAFYERGARVVALADRSGGLFNLQGINIPLLEKYCEDNRILFGFPGAEAVHNFDVLKSECDLLVLAAAPGQIHAANAGQVRASVVIEGTRRAITLPAEKILLRGNVRVVPEIMATAGQTIASFLEWRSNVLLENTGAGLDRELPPRIEQMWAGVICAAERHDLDWRRTANILAADRLAAGLRLR